MYFFIFSRVMYFVAFPNEKQNKTVEQTRYNVIFGDLI